MKLFREWCRALNGRKGLMLSPEAFETVLKGRDPGYSSVYAFDEAAAKVIKEQGHSREFSRFIPYADALIIDLDGGLPDLEVTKLRLEGYSYDVWESGGKGFHIVLKHELIGDIRLPYSHRQWVESKGIPADLSLFQPGRIVSLPGRVHPKTKKKKRFVESVKGNLTLEIPLLDPPEQRIFIPEVTDKVALFTLAIERVGYLASNEPTPGNRHQRLWGAAKDLAEIGLSYETALELLHGVNEVWQNSKEEGEVTRAVQDGFRLLTRSQSSSSA